MNFPALAGLSLADKQEQRQLADKDILAVPEKLPKGLTAYKFFMRQQYAEAASEDVCEAADFPLHLFGIE